MSALEESKSLIIQFAENLKQIPNDIIDGILQSMEDEDAKAIINGYSMALKNQFSTLASMLIENAQKMSKETARRGEDLLKSTSGLELTNQIKDLCSHPKSSVTKIGLAGLIHMIKKIIKWLFHYVFKPPAWLNDLLDLIDEIINEILGIGSPKLADILSQKEQNYLSELTRLAVLNREERYLFDDLKGEDV